MAPKSQLLTYVERLGTIFARQKMPHVKPLRLFYLAAEHDLLLGQNDLDIQWSEDETVEWMRTLRVPPFHTVYRVRPMGSLCARCRGASKIAKPALIEATFPGGARKRCPSCNAVWIEEDKAPRGT